MTHLDGDILPRAQVVRHRQGKPLSPRESQAVSVVPREVLQREDTHTDQVGAMDALIALRQHRLDALGRGREGGGGKFKCGGEFWTSG